MAEAPLLRRYSFRFLGAAAFGCLRTCVTSFVEPSVSDPSGGLLRWLVVTFGVLWGLSFSFASRSTERNVRRIILEAVPKLGL